MKHFFLSTIFMVLFISCESSEVREGRKAYQDYFQEVLSDPKSLDILSEQFEQVDMRVYWTIDYTAKNKIGGTVRATDYFLTIGDYLKTFDSKEEYLKSISEDCTPQKEENIISVEVENVTDSISAE